MKTIFYSFALFVLLFLSSVNLIAQNVYGPEQPNYVREIWKIDSNPLTSNLVPLDQFSIIGKNLVGNEQGESRVVIQWNIPDNVIPDNSTITSVELYFTYSKYNHNFEMNAQFSSISLDISNPSQNDLDQIWNEMNTTAIGTKTGVNDVIDFISNDPNDPFNIAIRNALENDRFVLGIIAYVPPSVSDRIWHIQNPSITLKIEFTPPSQLITIDQRLSTGQQVGDLRKWEGTQFTDPPFTPGSQFTFPVGSEQVTLGDQSVISNQKYNNWNEDLSDVTNFHKFTITSTTDLLISNFDPTYNSVIIKNSPEGTTADGGNVQFADPWFIDYPDPQFGNTRRNRGMNDAVWRTRTSPFNLNYNDPYEYGQAYQGVFLDQDPNFLPDIPNYSVGAVDGQTINVHNQNRKFYHYKWEGTDVSFHNYSALQTGVVFHSTNAVVKDILKGNLMSDDQNGISSSSQREMVRTDNGIYHVVYESMGNVWYTYSLTPDFYGEWSKDELEFYDAKNPSFDYEGNTAKIALRHSSLLVNS